VCVPFSAETRKYEDFLAVFQKLLPKFDENTIPEDHFHSLVAKTSKSFDTDEINQHLDKLCNEGKLMKSDGVLYFID